MRARDSIQIMTARSSTLALLILVSPVSQAGAQRLTTFASSRPVAYHPGPLFPAAPDHRWEGVVIGGLGLGLFGLTVASSFCGDRDSGRSGGCLLPTVEGFLIGATIGTVVGGIIGGAIPKHRAPTDSSAAP